MSSRTLSLTVLSVLLAAASTADATLMRTYVTGELGAAHVIFEVTFDPTVAGSAVPVVAVTETRPGYRLDGIDFVAGATGAVVVGAQLDPPAVGGPAGGAITHYNVTGVGPAILPDFIPATNAAAGAGVTRPSSVLTTAGHYLYTENQFGFAGPPDRIMRTPVGATPGMASVVFDGAAAAPLLGTSLINLEGLEIVGSRLYFFAEDHDDPGASRALYSVALDAGGLFDPAAPVPIIKESGGLGGVPDGADELDFDPSTGLIFGSNMLTGEIIFDDPGVPGGGGVLISAGEIGMSGDPSLDRLGTARLDGIRSTGDGFLVLTGLDGVIASIDIAMALAPGPAIGAVNILFDSPTTHSFDDLTPLIPARVPEPPALALLAMIAGIVALRRSARGGRRRRRGITVA